MTAPRRLALFAAVAAVALAVPPEARAGTYRAAVCHPRLRAGSEDAAFSRTSKHYRASASCREGGEGLAVTHEGRSTRAGKWGGWLVRAPSGTGIAALRMKAAGRAGGGHVPELLTGPLGGALAPFAQPNGDLASESWSGAEAGAFAARLRCRREAGCGPGGAARVLVRRLVLTLRDPTAPDLGLGGTLFAGGARRGVVSADLRASDVGSGVRRLLVAVNGEPLTARTVNCSLAQGIATRLRPCPEATAASLSVATTLAPFRQGPNVIRACAADLASGTTANRGCEARRVRVDNACPVSEVGGATRLAARLRPASPHRGRNGGGRIVEGRLRGAGGDPVAGARACVATRVRLAGAVERVAATPLSDSQGRFRARLPEGPSREVRVACWPDSDHALERFLRLEARARPRLRLRPSRPLRNGERVRFRVALPGPARARREVHVQARANGRWLDVRRGRTGARGVYRSAYRFRATTGAHRYSFRALVPRQRGYPYRAGSSATRRVTVSP